jgi:hypothetical protein
MGHMQFTVPHVWFSHYPLAITLIAMLTGCGLQPNQHDLVFCKSLDKVIDGSKVNCPSKPVLSSADRAEEAEAAAKKSTTPVLSNCLLKNSAENCARNVAALDFSFKDLNARAASLSSATPSTGYVAAVDLPATATRTEPSQTLVQTQLDEERRKLAQERSKLEAEKAQREETKLASRISIQATATNPDANGDFTINIQTNADTASLKIDGDELGGKRDGNYVIKRVARVADQNTYSITARDVFGNTDTKTVSVARQAVDSRPTFARLNPANIKPQAGGCPNFCVNGVKGHC